MEADSILMKFGKNLKFMLIKEVVFMFYMLSGSEGTWLDCCKGELPLRMQLNIGLRITSTDLNFTWQGPTQKDQFSCENDDEIYYR